MNASEETLFVLTGCTAVGKTEWALRWAEANDAEIVSCDSLLFYRGMDIGTAKPTTSEQARVRHHLIDIREPMVGMDIGEYVPLAICAVKAIQDRGKRVLVTGGSGFYLKAFFEPVVDDVSVSDATRERLASLYRDEGLEGMIAALADLDEDYEESLDTQNPRRVLKALERCLETGKSLKELKEAFAAQTNALTLAPKQLVVLERNKEELDARIESRVELMLKAGLIDEVNRLRKQGFETNPSAAGAIGYRETLEYLDRGLSRDELVSSIIVNTKRLAKKQRTWFRSQLSTGNRLNISESEVVEVGTLFG